MIKASNIPPEAKFVSRWKKATIVEQTEGEYMPKITGYQLQVHDGRKLKIYSYDTFEEAYEKYNELMSES